MKKILLSVIVLAVGIGSFLYFSTPKETKANGFVTIELVDENGTIVVNENVDLEAGDTLFDVLSRNHTVYCANAAYKPTTDCKESVNGRVILGIDDVTSTWTTSFIAIYVNDEYSNYGIDRISLEKDTTYRFEYTVVGGGSS